MRIGLRIYKEFEKGPEIEFLASCRKCKYLDYYEGSQKGPYIEKVTCLKNNQSIYDSTKDEYRIYEYEMPIWCPSIDGEKLEKIINEIENIKIND
jgi:hypothetical protein